MKSVITCDMEGVIETINPDGEKLFGYSKEELVGKGTIKKVFEMSDSSKVAGCSIDEGKITIKSTVKIFREEKLISEVDIQSLRREKNQVKEVLSGLECGIGFYKFNEIKENDRLEFYLRVSNDKAK